MAWTHSLLIASSFLSLSFSAFASESEDISREIALLQAPLSTVLMGPTNLLSGCAAIGVLPTQRCNLAAETVVFAGVPPGGLNPLHVASSGSSLAVVVNNTAPGYSLQLVVNGAVCPLNQGLTECAVPVSSGNELRASIFPNGSGVAHVLKGAVLSIESVTLRRGYSRVLENLRARAGRVADGIDADLKVHAALLSRERYESASRADLERLFASLTVEHIPKLPDYNKIREVDGVPQWDGNGRPLRNTDCPDPATAAGDPDLRSHTPKECETLAIVASILNGESTFTTDQLKHTEAQLQQNGQDLSRIVSALKSFKTEALVRFQDLMDQLANKGIVSL